MTSAGFKRLGSGSIAATLSLALHALLLVPLVTGSSRGPAAHATKPPASNPPSPGMWIPLDDDASAPKADARSSPAAISRASLALRAPKDPLSAIGDAHVEIQDPEEDAANPAELSPDTVPPYVRYMGEVTARIQRLWAVPSAKNDFHCRALIRRGPAGEVQDLTLQPCDEDPALQASVLKAIRLAMPLPARPDPPAEMLTLDFAVFGAKAEGRSSSVQPGTADSRL